MKALISYVLIAFCGSEKGTAGIGGVKGQPQGCFWVPHTLYNKTPILKYVGLKMMRKRLHHKMLEDMVVGLPALLCSDGIMGKSTMLLHCTYFETYFWLHYIIW